MEGSFSKPRLSKRFPFLFFSFLSTSVKLHILLPYSQADKLETETNIGP